MAQRRKNSTPQKKRMEIDRVSIMDVKKSSRRAPEKKKPKTEEEKTLAAIRKRQRALAAALDEFYGEFRDNHPDLWNHRAYLMLIGTVYERLVGGSLELPMEELVQLAKVLADQTKVRGAVPVGKENRKKVLPGPERAAAATNDSEVPSHVIAEAIREVYGAVLK